MKKHLSVLMLLVRSVLLRLTALLVLMTGTVWLVFRLFAEKISRSSLEEAITGCRIGWLFALFFLLVTVLLCSSGCEAGAKSGYTLQRLQISERTVFFWQALINCCCYFLLWTAAVGAMLLICRLWSKIADPYYFTNQTIFLAFYRSRLLHSLLPLASGFHWARNFCLLAGLSFASAAFSYRQRHHSLGGEIILLSALTVLWFDQSIGMHFSDFVIIFAAIILAGFSIWFVMRKEELRE